MRGNVRTISYKPQPRGKCDPNDLAQIVDAIGGGLRLAGYIEIRESIRALVRANSENKVGRRIAEQANILPKGCSTCHNSVQSRGLHY